MRGLKTVWGVVLTVAMAVAIGGCGAEAEETDSVELAAQTPRQYLTYPRDLIDATIIKASPNTNYGGSGTCQVNGSGASQRVCFMRWDLRAVPSVATVLSATLKFDVYDWSFVAGGGGRYTTFGVDQVYGAWDEAGVTWNSKGAAGLWRTPGARNAADRAFSPFVYFQGSPGIHEISLFGDALAVVRAWVLAPESNHGVVIDSISATDNLGIRSNQATTNTLPQLLVGFQEP